MSWLPLRMKHAPVARAKEAKVSNFEPMQPIRDVPRKDDRKKTSRAAAS